MKSAAGLVEWKADWKENRTAESTTWRSERWTWETRRTQTKAVAVEKGKRSQKNQKTGAKEAPVRRGGGWNDSQASGLGKWCH